MPVRVGIIDFGMGNLRSVNNAVQAVGAQAEYIDDPEKISLYDRLILPGVGAFGEAMARLQQTGMAQSLDEQVKAGKPILGLCLGMQMMCSESEEGGKFRGLGWFKAKVRRFPDRLNLKVPHVGWNDLSVVRDHPLFAEIGPEPDVYFVHSYRVECEDPKNVLAWCEYGEPFAAIIGHENILGIQFHPEKSQRVGLAMLHNFVGGGIC